MYDLLEKVLDGIEEVRNSGIQCPLENVEPHRCFHFPEKLIDEIVSLLKAQEPQTVIVDDIPKDDTWFGIWFGRCPNCKEMLTKKYHKHFCGNCGQEVKWSG